MFIYLENKQYKSKQPVETATFIIIKMLKYWNIVLHADNFYLNLKKFREGGHKIR